MRTHSIKTIRKARRKRIKRQRILKAWKLVASSTSAVLTSPARRWFYVDTLEQIK